MNMIVDLKTIQSGLNSLTIGSKIPQEKSDTEPIADIHLCWDDTPSMFKAKIKQFGTPLNFCPGCGNSFATKKKVCTFKAHRLEVEGTIPPDVYWTKGYVCSFCYEDIYETCAFTLHMEKHIVSYRLNYDIPIWELLTVPTQQAVCFDCDTMKACYCFTLKKDNYTQGHHRFCRSCLISGKELESLRNDFKEVLQDHFNYDKQTADDEIDKLCQWDWKQLQNILVQVGPLTMNVAQYLPIRMDTTVAEVLNGMHFHRFMIENSIIMSGSKTYENTTTMYEMNFKNCVAFTVFIPKFVGLPYILREIYPNMAFLNLMPGDRNVVLRADGSYSILPSNPFPQLPTVPSFWSAIDLVRRVPISAVTCDYHREEPRMALGFSFVVNSEVVDICTKCLLSNPKFCEGKSQRKSCEVSEDLAEYVCGPLHAQMFKVPEKFNFEGIPDRFSVDLSNATFKVDATETVERLEKTAHNIIADLKNTVYDMFRVVTDENGLIVRIIDGLEKVVSLACFIAFLREDGVSSRQRYLVSVMYLSGNGYLSGATNVLLTILKLMAQRDEAKKTKDGVLLLEIPEEELNAHVKTEGMTDLEENLLMSLCKVVAGWFKKSDIVEQKFNRERAKNIVEAWKVVGCIRSALDFVYKLYNYVTELIFGNSKMLTDVEKQILIEEIHSFEKRVSEHLPSDLEKGINSDLQICLMIKDLYVVGTALRTKLEQAEIQHTAFQVFSQSLLAIEKFMPIVHRRLSSDAGRHRPVVVITNGCPGVGKTNLLKFLIHDLYRVQHPDVEFQWSQAMYPRLPGAEYWEGYCNQFATFIDEIWQADQAEKRMSAALDVINMANDATFSLNMAFEGKGTTFFTSEFVGITCNGNFIPNGLNIESPAALQRRFNFNVTVDIKDDYRDPKTKRLKYGQKWSRKVYSLKWTVEDKNDEIFHGTYFDLLTECVLKLKEYGSVDMNIAKFLKEDGLAHLDEEISDFMKTSTETVVREKGDMVQKRYAALKHIKHILSDQREDLDAHGLKEVIQGVYLTAVGTAQAFIPRVSPTTKRINKLINYFSKWVVPAAEDYRLALEKYKVARSDLKEHYDPKPDAVAQLNVYIGVATTFVEYLKSIQNSVYETDWDLFHFVHKSRGEIGADWVETMFAMEAIYYVYTGKTMFTRPQETSDVQKEYAKLFQTWLVKVSDTHQFCTETAHSFRHFEDITAAGYGGYKGWKKLILLNAQMSKKEEMKRLKNKQIFVGPAKENKETKDVVEEIVEKQLPKKGFNRIDLDFREAFHSFVEIMEKNSHNLKSKIEDIRAKILDWKPSIDRRVWFGVGSVIALGAVFAVGFGSYKLFAQSPGVSGDEETQRAKRVKVIATPMTIGEKVVIQDPVVAELKAQMSLDNNATDLATNTLLPNLCSLSWSNKTANFGGLWCLFLREREFITTYHFLQNRKPGFSHIRLSAQRGNFEFHISKIEWVRVGEDMVKGTILDSSFGQFPDITHHIMDPSELKVTDLACVGRLGYNGKMPEIVYGPGALRQDVRYKDIGGAIESYHLPTCMRISVPSEASMCGLPYVIFNTRFQKKLIGIHVAGSDKIGICHFIPIKQLENLEAHGSFSLNLESKNIEVVATIPPKEQVRLPVETEIRPSVIQGSLQVPDTAPSVLRPVERDGVRVSPIEVAFSKFEKVKSNLSVEKKSLVFDIARDLAHRLKCPHKLRKLTLNEALNGVPQWSHTKAIDMTTSCGYREKLLNPATAGKLGLVVNVGSQLQPHWVLKDEYRPIVEEYVKSMSTDSPQKTFWQICLKDERRPLEKIKLVKTRIFQASEFRHLLARRIYFQAIVENLMSDPVYGPFALGIDVHSADWELLYRRLSRFGNKTRALFGDFKGFDGSINDLMNQAFRIFLRTFIDINKMELADIAESNQELKELLIQAEDLLAMDNLNQNTYDALYVVMDKIFKIVVPGSNPSGDLLTTIYNCIVNVIAHVYCGVSAAREVGVPSVTKKPGKFVHFQIDDYWKLFELSVFGDDNLETTEQEWYTMSLKIKYMFELGLTYQDAAKTGKIDKEFYSMEEVTFLKRKFFHYRNRVLAPLPINVVLEISNWIRECSDHSAATSVNVKAMTRELYHHGEEVYDFWFNKAQAALKNAHCPKMVWESWDTLDQNVFGEYNDTELFAHMSKVDGVSEVNERDALTEFADSHTVLASETRLISPIYGPTDPYRDQKLQTIMSRNFEVASFKWNGSTAIGDTINTLSFPAALYYIPALKQIMDRFRYFRGGVKIGYRVNSTSFHFGQLMICWQPYVTTATPRRTDNIFQASGLKNLIISATTANVVEFFVPYIGEYAYIDMNNIGATEQAYICEISTLVLHPLSLAGSASTPIVEVTVFANFVDPELCGLIAQMEKETEEKTRTNKMSSIVEAVSKGMQVMSVIPVIGGEMAIASAITKASAIVLRAFGYTKTLSDKAPTYIVQNPMGDVSFGTGVEHANKVSLDPQNLVKSDVKYFCTDLDYDQIKNYVLQPMIFQIGMFNASFLTHSQVISFPVCPWANQFTNGNITYPTYVGTAVVAHKFWRGMMKYRIGFITSPYVTARVRIVWSPVKMANVLNPGEAGNVISRIIDITGDTEITFSVPYFNRKPYQMVPPDWNERVNSLAVIPNDLTSGWIHVYVVNPPVTLDNTTSTTIGYNVWVSGGEDFVVARPTSVGYYFRDSDVFMVEERFVAQMDKKVIGIYDVRSKFQQTFDALAPARVLIQEGAVMGEVTNRWTEYFTRYHVLARWEGGLSNRWTQKFDDLFKESNWDYQKGDPVLMSLFQLFKFYRGSFRIKVLPSPDGQTLEFTRVSNFCDEYAGGYYSAGASILYGDQKLANEVEIPYYSQKYFHVNGSDFPESWGVKMDWKTKEETTALFDVLFSISTDFNMGWPLPHPGLYASLVANSKSANDNAQTNKVGAIQRRVPQKQNL